MSNYIKSEFPFYKDEKIAVFIDGSNLYSSAKLLGFDIDYEKLLKWLEEKSRLIRAFYYTAIIDDQDYSPVKPLVDWLNYNGYTTVTKPAKELIDENGKKRIKSDITVDIIVDVMDIADKVNHIILFSGDGIFRKMIESVQRKGVRVTVISTLNTQPPMMSDELRRQADYFFDLADIESAISRKN